MLFSAVVVTQVEGVMTRRKVMIESQPATLCKVS